MPGLCGLGREAPCCATHLSDAIPAYAGAHHLNRPKPAAGSPTHQFHHLVAAHFRYHCFGHRPTLLYRAGGTGLGEFATVTRLANPRLQRKHINRRHNRERAVFPPLGRDASWIMVPCWCAVMLNSCSVPPCAAWTLTITSRTNSGALGRGFGVSRRPCTGLEDGLSQFYYDEHRKYVV